MHLPETNSNSVCSVLLLLLQNPNIILNTAVAESLRQFYEKLKDVPADEMESAVHELLKQTIIDHKRVIFNGNGYTDEWLEEAKKRGLYNLVSTPDALPHFIDEKNEKLLTSHHIFHRRRAAFPVMRSKWKTM